MMDLGTLYAVNRRTTNKARRHGKQPLVLDANALALARQGDLSAIRIPSLGDYIPRGWTQIDPRKWHGNRRGVYELGYFVDKSGFGAVGEPALTLGEFFDLAKPGFGYAVVEEGQFQVHVGVFQPPTRAKVA